MTISFVEGGYIRITCNHFKVFNYCIDFKEGEEFEEILFSGESVRKVIQTEKNKWTETQLSGKHSGVTFIREIKEDGLLKVVSKSLAVTLELISNWFFCNRHVTTMESQDTDTSDDNNTESSMGL